MDHDDDADNKNNNELHYLDPLTGCEVGHRDRPHDVLGDLLVTITQQRRLCIATIALVVIAVAGIVTVVVVVVAVVVIVAVVAGAGAGIIVVVVAGAGIGGSKAAIAHVLQHLCDSQGTGSFSIGTSLLMQQLLVFVVVMLLLLLLLLLMLLLLVMLLWLHDHRAATDFFSALTLTLALSLSLLHFTQSGPLRRRR